VGSGGGSLTSMYIRIRPIVASDTPPDHTEVLAMVQRLSFDPRFDRFMFTVHDEVEVEPVTTE
jgi:hypothetical protein